MSLFDSFNLRTKIFSNGTLIVEELPQDHGIQFLIGDQPSPDHGNSLRYEAWIECSLEFQLDFFATILDL